MECGKSLKCCCTQSNSSLYFYCKKAAINKRILILKVESYGLSHFFLMKSVVSRESGLVPRNLMYLDRTILMERFLWNSLLWELSLCPCPPHTPLVRGFWSVLSRQSAEGLCEGLVSPYRVANNPFWNWKQDIFFCFLPPSLGGWDMEITSSRDKQGPAGPILVHVSLIPAWALATPLPAVAYWPCCLLFHLLTVLCFREWYIFHLECEVRI